MTWLDYAVIIILALSIAWGAWRGLVHEVLSLAGWILAFVAANVLAAPLSGTRSGRPNWPQPARS